MGIAIGALALTYYIGYEGKRQASLNLSHTQASLATPSISNLSITPSPTPTITPKVDISDWKTYINEKYGFEFKYPPSLQIGGNDEELLGSYAGQSINISIKIVPLQDFSVLHPTWKRMSPRTKNIDQINAMEYYDPNKEGSTDDKRFVYISLSNQAQKQIEIFAELGFADATENFNEILSTFKFIEKDETSDWKTYRDEKKGYEIKYPGDITEGIPSVTVTDTSDTNLPSKCPTIDFDPYESGDPIKLEGKKTTINNITYCEYETSESTAGTSYVFYTYTTINNKKLYTIDFSPIGFPDCKNYEDQGDCEKTNDDKLKVVEKILSTLKFIK